MVDQTASSGSTGAGQQFPDDGNSEFQMIAFIVQQMMARLDTMKPVKVIAVHGGTTAAGAGTVDVMPLVNQIDGSGNSTPHGTVYGIPWMRLGAGKTAIIMDPVVGDFGVVVCADRDISAVKSAAGDGKDPQVNPGSRRRYNIADGVYVGAFLQKDAPEQYITFVDDKITVHDKTGNVVELSSSGITLSPSGVLPVTVNGNFIVTGNVQIGGSVLAQDGTRYTGAISTTGDIIAGTISLKNHVHTQPNDGHGDLEHPTNAPTP